MKVKYLFDKNSEFANVICRIFSLQTILGFDHTFCSDRCDQTSQVQRMKTEISEITQ